MRDRLASPVRWVRRSNRQIRPGLWPVRGVPVIDLAQKVVPVTNEAKTSGFASNRTTWISAVAFSTVIAAHAFGVLGQITFPLVICGGIACAFIGIRQHRPTLRWPWWAMVSSGVLFAIAGVAREATGATGDLTTNRSLIPDMFALPATPCSAWRCTAC